MKIVQATYQIQNLWMKTNITEKRKLYISKVVKFFEHIY